jgi:uncharacterized membrane protein
MRQSSTHNRLGKKLLSTTALLLALFSPLQFDWQASLETRSVQLQSDRAEAKKRSSGGRSSGGSFNRRSSGSSSGSSGSSSGSSGSSRRSSDYYDDDYYSPRRTRTIYRDNYYYGDRHYGYRQSNDLFSTIIVMLLIIGAVGLVIYLIRVSLRGNKSNQPKDLQNDIVTVTQLQVAVFDQCDLQVSLSDITLQADTESPEGLNELLKESVLALLRSPETWAAVRSQSQMVKTREAAAAMFEKISIEERSKVGSEQLVNVGGRIREAAIAGEEDVAPGYVVMTLLVGTEHDKPLFEPIRTMEQLKAGLEQLAAIPTEYLLTVELLWSPQNSSENLSQDDFLELYPELLPLV